MKNRAIIILLIAILLPSCEGVIAYNPSETGTKLIVTGLFDAQDSEHRVYLALSDILSTSYVSDGSITCYVNGNSQGTSTLAADSARFSNVVFPAKFSAGDELEIVASAEGGKYHSNVKLLVPEPAILKSIDTASVRSEGSNYMRFTLNISDVSPEADYYYISVCDSDGYYLSLDISDEPILMSEVTAMMEDLVGLMNYNYSCCFTDKSFNGGDAKLRVKLPKGDVEKGDTLTFKVHHVSEEYYHYLKAWNTVESGVDETGLIFEMPTIPGNVDGALGFVGVSNSARKAVVIK